MAINWRLVINETTFFSPLFASLQNPDVQFDRRDQGCQMVYLQTKNPDLGKFWRVLQWKMMVYFMANWSILRQIGIFMAIWCILQRIGIFYGHFGMLYQEKSGNSAGDFPVATIPSFGPHPFLQRVPPSNN
jgi:hypothetical protein